MLALSPALAAPSIEMNLATRLQRTVAAALKLDPMLVTPDLSYQSTVEWDSLAHVGLMLALEQEFGVSVAPMQVLDLVTIPAIEAFIGASVRPRTTTTAAAPATTPTTEEPAVHRGLSGVHFDRSRITKIDGQAGRLSYRGFDIGEVAEHLSFEETLHLLVFGEIPDHAQLSAVCDQLETARYLPEAVAQALVAMKDATPMAALRTGVSMLAAFSTAKEAKSPWTMGLRLVSQIPLIVATHQAARQGRRAPSVPLGVRHAEFVLRIMAPDLAVTPEIVCAFEQDLVIHADHSANAATFAARVATGTESDFLGAVTAAISTFAGARHGGAVEDVMVMLDEIGDPARAADYIRHRQANNLPIFGFGHRVYRTADPRAKYLRGIAEFLARKAGQERYLAILDAVVEEMAARSRLGIDVNVDFYAAVAYKALGFEADLFAPLFVMGRIAGWIAHVKEQQESNILIRPLLQYVGPVERRLVQGTAK